MNIFVDGRLCDEARQLDEQMAQESLKWACERDEYYPADMGYKNLNENVTDSQIMHIGHVASDLEIAS